MIKVVKEGINPILNQFDYSYKCAYRNRHRRSCNNTIWMGYTHSRRRSACQSGQKALGLVKQLKLRNEIVALLLVDQRMPQMTGVEFLEQSIEIFPEAKRVLLTAFADTEAAIRSINKARIDYYLMKPWDPPEEHLFPILDDLLDDWWASFKPPYEGIRVIGLRWSPKSHDLKRFLARNGIPY